MSCGHPYTQRCGSASCPNCSTTSDQTIDIGCIPLTDGEPTTAPESNELPFAYDSGTQILWLYDCSVSSWVSFNLTPGICSLPPVTIDTINDVCNILNIPVSYDSGGGCQQGNVSLANLSTEIGLCLGIDTLPTTVVDEGANVTVVAVTVGPVTTYTISADNDKSIVVQTNTGNEIATHDDGTGTLVSIQETITTLASDGSNGINYTQEDGSVTNIAAALLGVDTISVMTQVQGSGNEIANHDDGTGNVVSILETTTTIAADGTGGLNYTDEEGVITNIPGGSLNGATSVMTNTNSGKVIAVHNDGDGTLINIEETITTLASDGADGIDYTDEDGIISNIPAAQLGVNDKSVLTQVVLTGNDIATHNDGTGVVVDIRETVTSLASDVAGGLDYTQEDGSVQNISSSLLGDRITSVITPVASVTASSRTITNHDDGTGVVVEIKESISTVAPRPLGGFIFTGEDNVPVDIPDIAAGSQFDVIPITVTAAIAIPESFPSFETIIYNRTNPDKQVLVIITSKLIVEAELQLDIAFYRKLAVKAELLVAINIGADVVVNELNYESPVSGYGNGVVVSTQETIIATNAQSAYFLVDAGIVSLDFTRSLISVETSVGAGHPAAVPGEILWGIDSGSTSNSNSHVVFLEV